MENICVLHIVSALKGGGVERVLYNYFSHMNMENVKMSIAVLGENEKQFMATLFLDLNIDIVYLSSDICMAMRRLNSILKKKEYNIVHCHVEELSVFYLYVAWINKVPVRIAHGHMAHTPLSITKILKKTLLYFVLNVFVTQRFACGKEAAKSLWGNRALSKGKVLVLNNAIDKNIFKFDMSVRLKKRHELNIEDNTLVVGSVGRFAIQKNQNFLIDIFYEIRKKRKNALLLLVGEGTLECKLKQQVAALGLVNSVLFLGLRNDVPELMQAMDLFLLPSLYEGLPVVGVEAQCMGLLSFFSDSITDEMKLSDNSIFVSLKKSAFQWCEIILKYYDEGKERSSGCIDASFDIFKEADRLKSYYSGMLLKNE